MVGGRLLQQWQWKCVGRLRQRRMGLYVV